MNRENFNKELGSFTLGTLFSIAMGITFTLLFVNLSRYLTAESAIDEALRKTARCLTPTDPDCINVNNSPTIDYYDWYLKNSGESKTLWVDRYNYKGTYYTQDWQLNYPIYEIHKVKPPLISYPQYELTQKTFFPEVNKYEYRFLQLNAALTLDMTKQVQIYRPKYQPNFPEIDLSYERDKRDEAIINWQPQMLMRDLSGNPLSENDPIFKNDTLSQAVNLAFDEGRIFEETREIKSSNRYQSQLDRGVSEFVTPFYFVPKLTTNSSNKLCLNDKNQTCDIQYASGNHQPIWDYASVAIKAFGTFRNLKGNPDIRWAGSPRSYRGNAASPQGWGLQIETLSAAEYQNWLNNKQPQIDQNASNNFHYQCLGGSAPKNIEGKTNWTNYHLRLRGAIEHRDNENDSTCPNNDKQHWNLSVERGGAYRIRAWIKVENGDALAKLTIKHYYDDYVLDNSTNQLPQNITCNKAIQLKQGDNYSNCPYRELCSEISSDYQLSSCESKINTIPLCLSETMAAADEYTFKSIPHSCNNNFTTLSCDNNGIPNLAPTCDNLEPNRLVCNWQENVNKRVSVNTLSTPKECKVAPVNKVITTCGINKSEITYNKDNNYGDIQLCPSLADINSKSQNEINSINSRLSPEALKIDFAKIDFSWMPAEEFTPQLWRQSFSPVDENGNTLTAKESIRTSDITLQNIKEILKTKDVKAVPNLSFFNLSQQDQSYLETNPIYHLKLLSEHNKELSSSYPFENKPEFEIPNFLPKTENLNSCSGDTESIEKRLRAYAANIKDELSDEKIIFNNEATYVDSLAVNASHSCSNTTVLSSSLPKCTTTSAITSTNENCNNTYLGRFSNLEFPNGPEVCQNNSGKCISLRSLDFPYSITNNSSIEVNKEKAISLGNVELNRALQNLAFNCNTDNCANITVERSEEQTKVEAAYNMPLSFPLNQILGKSYLTIKKQRTESNQLAISGVE
ncbi:MAG: hypothetical protein KBC84_05335 [Proteobacteria bacterium]|nr:hypothetical protein [Pseudomonadota bacterium]